MAEVIHRYVGKNAKVPKVSPEKKKRAAEVHENNSELAKERGEGLRVKRMQSQLLFAKARGELIPKATAQAQVGFLVAALRSKILAIPQSYSRRLLNISDFGKMSKLLKKMSLSIRDREFPGEGDRSGMAPEARRGRRRRELAWSVNRTGGELGHGSCSFPLIEHTSTFRMHFPCRRGRATDHRTLRPSPAAPANPSHTKPAGPPPWPPSPKLGRRSPARSCTPSPSS